MARRAARTRVFETTSITAQDPGDEPQGGKGALPRRSTAQRDRQRGVKRMFWQGSGRAVRGVNTT
jgi:hypothetical protein